jgi:hypothetical protein
MIMKKILSNVIVIVIVIVIASLPSCDIIEEPYLVPVGSNGPGPGDNVRKVLLEDYTGQKCPNCPEAAEIAHNLQALYGEQLILLTVHAGFYSTPDATGDFTADFRTPEGMELNTFFEIPAYPMGMVNRTEYSGSRVLLKDSWEAAVAIQTELDAAAAITITNTYNAGTRKLDCLLETEFLETKVGTYNICAFITESGIISPQQTAQNVNLTYEHNHVLRGSMNGTWGDLVGEDGQAIVGTVLTNSYSFTLPSGWNADNCAVVAFIYNTESNEVAQAEEKSVN